MTSPAEKWIPPMLDSKTVREDDVIYPTSSTLGEFDWGTVGWILRNPKIMVLHQAAHCPSARPQLVCNWRQVLEEIWAVSLVLEGGHQEGQCCWHFQGELLHTSRGPDAPLRRHGTCLKSPAFSLKSLVVESLPLWALCNLKSGPRKPSHPQSPSHFADSSHSPFIYLFTTTPPPSKIR